MKAELIWGTLIAVDGENLTISTTSHTPEGETLVLPSQGLGINESWINTWLGTGGVRFTVIDGVVKDVSER